MKDIFNRQAATEIDVTMIDPADVAYTIPFDWGRLRVSEAAQTDFGFQPRNNVRYTEGDVELRSEGKMGMPPTDLLIVGRDELLVIPTSRAVNFVLSESVAGISAATKERVAATITSVHSAQQLANQALWAIMSHTERDQVEEPIAELPEWPAICSQAGVESAGLLLRETTDVFEEIVADAIDQHSRNRVDKQHLRVQKRLAAAGIGATTVVGLGNVLLFKSGLPGLSAETFTGGVAIGAFASRRRRYKQRQETFQVTSAMRAQAAAMMVALDVGSALEPGEF